MGRRGRDRTPRAPARPGPIDRPDAATLEARLTQASDRSRARGFGTAAVTAVSKGAESAARMLSASSPVITLSIATGGGPARPTPIVETPTLSRQATRRRPLALHLRHAPRG